MKFKTYQKYKNTGIEWLGEIPENWNVVRLRFIFTIKKRIAGSLGYDVLSITQQGIKIKDIESNDGQNSQDYSKYQIVKIGDFAMNHMDLLTGFVDISKYYGVTSPDYRVFSLCDSENNDPQYFLQILQMCYLQEIFYPFGQGASQFGRWRLPTEAFKDFSYPVPALATQRNISAYLDMETARIDSLIQDYTELIRLLQEKRQMIIGHAVTRGISELVLITDHEFGEWAKIVMYKDSGVEWLGEIPDGWVVKKLKYCAFFSGGGTPSTDNEEYWHGTIPWVSSKDMKTEEIWETEDYITLEGLNNCPARKVEPNSILLVMRSGVLRHTIPVAITKVEVTVNQDIRVIKFSDKIVPSFFLRFVQGMNSILLALLQKQGATVESIEQEYLANCYLPVPPLQEQYAIIEYCLRESNKIDLLIKQTEDAIDLLKEHRSALITNVVTGKINVEETA